jgi:NADH-quinone oxidoreductase subunit J
VVELLFLIFGVAALIGAAGVVFLSNIVHSVLALVFAFLNVAAIYIILDAEFIALSTIIVYVGAISVLLLFVVMTLTAPLNGGFFNLFYPYRYWIIGLGLVLGLELISLMLVGPTPIQAPLKSESHIYSIGMFLYTHYMFLIILLAVLLFISMVGAVLIVFQTRNQKNVKRQSAQTQIDRNPDEVVTLVNVNKRDGI